MIIIMKELEYIKKIKSYMLKQKISNFEVSGPFYYAGGVEKTQKERALAWMKILFALVNHIPIVFLGSNPTRKYENYVKKVCKNLDVQADTAIIFFTSGSTGKPKAIQRSYNKLFFADSYFIERTEITKNMIMADYRGTNTDAGLHQLLRAIFGMAQFVFIDSTQDYSHIVSDMIKNNIQYCNASALQWHGMANVLEEENLYWDLKVAINTTGTPDKDSLEILKKRTKCKVFTSYAMSEIGVVCMLDPEMINEKRTSVGKPIDGVNISIVNNEKQVCMPYEEGEVVIDSEYISYPNVSPYSTGDSGYLDEDGCLYLTGRKGDILKIKGRTVNAMQIENAYSKYQSVVFGVTVSIIGGHEGVMVIETNDTLKNVKEYIRDNEPPVSDVCRPRWIFISKKLPRLASGKFDRMKIKKVYTDKVSKKKKVKVVESGKLSKNETEIKLINIWENILNLQGITRTDNFLELGGKSLRVMSMLSRIKRVFGIELFPRDVYKNITVKDLAKKIDKMLSLK